VLAVNFRGLDDVAKFRELTKVTYPLVLDKEQRVVKRFVDGYLPWNAVVDRDGVVRFTKLGWDANVAEIKKVLKEAIAAGK